MYCPRCSFPLTQFLHKGYEIDHCERCQGSLILHSAAAAAFGPEVSPEFWKQSYIHRNTKTSTMHCPKCTQAFNEYTIALQTKEKKRELVLDECAQCHSIWFDRQEGPHLKSIIEDKARHDLAMGQRKGTIKGYLFQLLTQFPVEVWNPLRHRPWMVYSLVMMLIVLFLWELINPMLFSFYFDSLLMIPQQVGRGEHVWTIFSAGFFHADWPHLLGNLWMLWIFGDNIEDILRKKHFLLLYIFALLTGNLAHFLVDVHSPNYLLGASGAISGLMGAYLVLFPRVKV